jgi:hypothetical protein
VSALTTIVETAEADALVEFEVDHLEARVAADVTPGLCPSCRGARYDARNPDNPTLCAICHGDGLARHAVAEQADAARLSVDWLT